MENKKWLIWNTDVQHRLVDVATERGSVAIPFGRITSILFDENLAVDAAPVVHGRWISDGLGDGERICSVCKRYALYTHRDRYDQYLTTYCPNCGAKMDKEN